MTRSRLLSSVAALAAVAGLAACASQPKSSASLDTAVSTYQVAASNPDVVAKAPLELQSAQAALADAQNKMRNGAPQIEVDHSSYLATRRAQIAIETAQLKDAQEVVANADASRAQALLTARTIQAQQANLQAQQAETRAAILQEQANRLQDELNARPTDRGMVLTLGSDILFDTGRATLKPGAYPRIQKVGAFLQQYPDRIVIIQGFTDNTGSASFNQELSKERADAVRIALSQYGVSSERVQTQGMGEDSPIASNDTEAGRQLNRRVELVVSNPPVQPGTLSGGAN